MRHSAGEAMKSGGGDLARSLLGGHSSGHGGAGGTSSGSGINRHSQLHNFLDQTNTDGTKKTFGEQQAARKEQGAAIGRKVMGLPESPPGDAQNKA
jgi:hypothetical protein